MPRLKYIVVQSNEPINGPRSYKLGQVELIAQDLDKQEAHDICLEQRESFPTKYFYVETMLSVA